MVSHCRVQSDIGDSDNGLSSILFITDSDLSAPYVVKIATLQ
jgi:hypothetical protein